MEFIVHDTNLNPLGIIEVYESAIWTERFRSVGDFEIHVPIVTPIAGSMAQDNYLILADTDRAMIIESINIISDEDTGKSVLVCKGSSLESILERRIVWKKTTLSGNPLNQLHRVFEENIIFSALSPSDPEYAEKSKRKIPNFIFPLPTSGDPVYEHLRGKTLKCQFTGDTMLDVVISFCETYGLDFKITITSDKKFKFELMLPVNHSANQVRNDIVIFSPKFDTLISSEWYLNSQYYKNVVLVHGEGEGNDRVRRVVYSEEEEPSGLARREMYADARDLTSKYDDGTDMTPAEYAEDLDYRGYQKLAENSYVSAFDGKVETSIGPQYGKNYNIGDYVTVINEFGLGSTAQVTEYIRAFDAQGYSAYPTFTMVV